jgi:fluoroquinolone transport system permease protein
MVSPEQQYSPLVKQQSKSGVRYGHTGSPHGLFVYRRPSGNSKQVENPWRCEAMKALYRSFAQMIRQMKTDVILVIIPFIPILLGCIFRYLIPIAEQHLTAYFGLNQILSPYYQLFDLFLLIITPSMFNYVAAMVILEEADDHMAVCLAVSPLGKSGYLFSRLGFTGIISFPISIVLVSIFRLTQMPLWLLSGAALAGTAQGITAALLIVSLSANKVEGIAVGKMASLSNLGAIVPYFVTGKAQYIASILPSFWIAKAIQKEGWGDLIVSIVLALVWILFLSKRFMQKITG